MAKNNKPQNAENKDVEEIKDIDTIVEAEEVNQTIRIQLFKTAYSSERGILKNGTIIEIDEADFKNWDNVAIELEE